MKALQILSKRQIGIREVEKPIVRSGQALVKINAAALNRRDQWIRAGMYPNIRTGTTLGSDASGQVVEVGDAADDEWVGKKVIINPNVNWGQNPEVQSSEYSVLGMPTDGTFAEYLAVAIDRLVLQPVHLTDEAAAALPLAGLTAYRALIKHGQVKSGDRVLISGFGGGVAQFAFQFALAVGAEVYVTSGDPEKVSRAVAMGAKEGFDYREEDWYKKVLNSTDGLDVVIDSAGGDQINSFIKIMRPSGRIIFYGATNGVPAHLDMFRMFWNQITLQGSTMGSDQEFEEMVQFVTQHQLVPILDSVRSFGEIVSAFDQMKKGNRIGKLVVKL